MTSASAGSAGVESLLEPSLSNAGPGAYVQFERLGYFCSDADTRPGAPVFNRTVGLRDSWAKAESASTASYSSIFPE
jgi:hypothetical protein